MYRPLRALHSDPFARSNRRLAAFSPFAVRLAGRDSCVYKLTEQGFALEDAMRLVEAARVRSSARYAAMMQMGDPLPQRRWIGIHGKVAAIADFREMHTLALDVSQVGNGFRTGSYCGLIQRDGWSLEICPKIFTRTGADPNRSLLVQMLGLCFDMPIWQDGLADADQTRDLLQIVLNAFVRECRQLGRKGWQKGYKEVEERLSFPRGRILITDQIRRGRAAEHQLDCRFSELTIDTPHNQAILACIVAGCRLARPWSRVERQLHSLAEELGTVTRVETTSEAIGRLPMDKLSARYERTLMLAGWLVGDAGSDVHRSVDTH